MFTLCMFLDNQTSISLMIMSYFTIFPYLSTAKRNYRLLRIRCWLPAISDWPPVGDGCVLLDAFTDNELESLLPACGALALKDLLVGVLKCAVLGELKLESILPRAEPTPPGSRILGTVPGSPTSIGSELPWQRVPQRNLSWFQAFFSPAVRRDTCRAP